MSCLSLALVGTSVVLLLVALIFMIKLVLHAIDFGASKIIIMVLEKSLNFFVSTAV